MAYCDVVIGEAISGTEFDFPSICIFSKHAQLFLTPIVSYLGFMFRVGNMLTTLNTASLVVEIVDNLQITLYAINQTPRQLHISPWPRNLCGVSKGQKRN